MLESPLGLQLLLKSMHPDTYAMRCAICYHLYNFKKPEKHPWRSVTCSKVAGFNIQSSRSTVRDSLQISVVILSEFKRIE